MNRLTTNATINCRSFHTRANLNNPDLWPWNNCLELSAIFNSILKDKIITRIFKTYILGSVFSLRCETTIILRFVLMQRQKLELVWEILFLTGNCLFDTLIIIILIPTFTLVLFCHRTPANYIIFDSFSTTFSPSKSKTMKRNVRGVAVDRLTGYMVLNIFSITNHASWLAYLRRLVIVFTFPRLVLQILFQIQFGLSHQCEIYHRHKWNVIKSVHHIFSRKPVTIATI